jgi:tetratricopeptide (TPR) repeat protein
VWRGHHHRRAVTLVCGFLLVNGALAAPAVMAQSRRPSTSVSSVLARADAEWARRDLVAAERDYAAVLAQDPSNSRALYRLAHLGTRSARERANLLERYVALEPDDAWGYLALAQAQADGDAAARRRAPETAAEAIARAPRERDIVLGRPRLLARLGRDEAAAEAFESWLRVHPRDIEAWQELAEVRQRAGRLRSATVAFQQAAALSPRDETLERQLSRLQRQTAATIELGLAGIGETDVATLGGRVGLDVHAGDTGRFAVTYQQRRMDSFGETARARRVGAQLSLRPRSDVRVSVLGGLTWTMPPVPNAAAQRHVDLGVRLRRAGRVDGVSWDVRGEHGPVDVNPEVIRADLERTQGGVAIDAPVSGVLRMRGTVRLAALRTDAQTNLRTAFGGGPAIRLAPGVHAGAQWAQVRYREPAVSGYFAPRLIEQLEGVLDVDRDFDAVSIGLDAGVGWHRFERHGASMGPWAPAARVWSYIAWSLQPGTQLLIESEAYSTGIAEFVPVSASDGRWRYLSVTASLRVALPNR